MNFSTIREIVPTVTSVFVLSGIVKALAFYSLFGIRIIDYIDFSESLLLFFDDLIIFCVALMFSLVSSHFYKKYPLSLVLFGLVLIISNSVYFYILLHNYYHLNPYLSLVQPLLLLLLSAWGFWHLYTGIKVEQPDAKPDLQIQMRLLILLFSLISVMAYRVKRDYDNIVYEQPDREVTCLFNDSSQVRTGIDTVYVGRTKNTLFFYSKQEKKALIYKSDQVKKTEIKTLRNPQINYKL